MTAVTVQAMINAIECRQEVLNKDNLSDDKLSISVQGVASLDKATRDTVSFLANARYVDSLKDTQAGVVLVDERHAAQAPPTSCALVVASPYLAYACVSQLFARVTPVGIHSTAHIAQSAQLGADVTVGAYAIIGDGVVIGDGAVIGAHTVIGDGAVIGAQTLIDTHVSIAHGCVIGRQCRIHAHASIGSEGFGFAPSSNPAKFGWERIAQLGKVVVGDRVRIGSQTCIDRGAVADTIIGDDVIIDNLVQIAHNVQIGAGTAIAAGTGIAGSTSIGKGCIIGGAVGIAGHLQIADFVTITAMSMVIKSIDKSGSYSSGTAAMPSANWRRAAVKFRQMGEH